MSSVNKTFVVVISLLILAANGVQAAPAVQTTKMKAGHSVTVSPAKYYVCTMCQLYYTPAQAKKDGYHCKMCGMNLTVTKSVPKGYKPAGN